MNRHILRGICSLTIGLASAHAAYATFVTINDIGAFSSYQNHLPPDQEIHVLGIYESGTHEFQQHVTGNPTVNVKYNLVPPMKPITLVLSSYEANVWHLNIDPGAKIDKIVLNGYYGQSVTGAGAIPILNYSVPGLPRLNVGSGSSAYAWPLSTGGSSTFGLIVGAENLLHSRISSFTGKYSASSFTITGSPASQQTVNPILGAGNLFDGANPDLIYNRLSGEVKIDLTDLSALYPFGGGSIWWQHFDAQRLFISLANHDGTFHVADFSPSDINRIGYNYPGAILNENRLGYDGVRLSNWHGELISLGQLLPRGIADASALRQYLAAAGFATDRERGDFDLVVIPEPGAMALWCAGLLLLTLYTGLRRRSFA